MGFVVACAPMLIIFAGILIVALSEICNCLMELLGFCREDSCYSSISGTDTVASDMDNFQYPYMTMNFSTSGGGNTSLQASIRASLVPLVFEGAHECGNAVMHMAHCSGRRRAVQVEDGGSMDCAVCLCEFEQGQEVQITPNCCHVFHSECIHKWLDQDRKTCPLCRTSLVAPSSATAWKVTRSLHHKTFDTALHPHQSLAWISRLCLSLVACSSWSSQEWLQL